MSTTALLAALLAGTLADIWSAPPYRRWPLLTLAIAVLTGATAALTAARLELLALLARDPAILSGGQVWRVLTALFAQDGGMAGTLFNLFWLLVLGSTAERRFARAQWAAVYFGGGIVTELLALAWQPHGAGNSIACLALAGALCGDWRAGRWRWWRIGAGVIGLASAVLLLSIQDIHGIGFVVGMAIGVALIPIRPVRREHLIDHSDNVVVFAPGTDTLH